MADDSGEPRDTGSKFDLELVRILAWAKRFVAALLLVAMFLLVAYATIQLFGSLILAFFGTDVEIAGLFAEDKLLASFGVFLTVLIALEFIETVESYLTEGEVRADKVVLIGIIAIGRKIILTDPVHWDPMVILGIAALTLALGLTFYLVRRGDPTA
jgi:uncharacterized membrane protein (DUF373 family)